MENKRILVIGGTGYIGTSLVKKLNDSNYDVTLLVRNGHLLNESNKCKYFIGNLLDKESLIEKINDFDLIINLASVVRTINKKKYTDNIIGLKNLIDVMEKKKIKRMIYFSTQNVNLKDKGYYSESKEICEKLLIGSNLEYIIIRPNYVYGIDKNNDFYRMAVFIAYSHIAPIIGNGNYKIQPVLKEDLANSTLEIITEFKSGSIIEVSGNETISIKEIIRLIGKDLKVNPLMLHIPIKLLKIFDRFIPFDVDGFTEDRISASPLKCQFSSFSDNLKKILSLIKTEKNFPE
ncbi:MAG: NAD(P)H-binding protein [Candidatus Methanoperedens sp.]|nr:NAD(P)H-binding protein [Candidatus Methanoperedens sp.]